MRRYDYDDIRWKIALIFSIIVVIIAFFLFTKEATPTDLPTRQQISLWQKAIVEVNYHNQSITTGWFIAENIICTSFHIIRGWVIYVDDFHIIIADYKKNTYKGEILAHDEGNDILFLRISHEWNKENAEYMKIKYKAEHWFGEYQQPHTYDRCVVMGKPYGWTAPLIARMIEHDRYQILGIDRIPMPESSGSVVLNEEGKYMAMVVSKLGYARVIPGILIKIHLESLLKAGVK